VAQSGLSSVEISQCSNINTGGGLTNTQNALVVTATIRLYNVTSLSGSSSVTISESYTGSGFDPGGLYIVLVNSNGSQCSDPLSNGPATFQETIPVNSSATVTMRLILGNAATNSKSELSAWTISAPTVQINNAGASGDIFGNSVVTCGGNTYFAVAGQVPTSLGAGLVEQTCQPVTSSYPVHY
jgi:hypothetical protein